MFQPIPLRVQAAAKVEHITNPIIRADVVRAAGRGGSPWCTICPAKQMTPYANDVYSCGECGMTIALCGSCQQPGARRICRLLGYWCGASGAPTRPGLDERINYDCADFPQPPTIPDLYESVPAPHILRTYIDAIWECAECKSQPVTRCAIVQNDGPAKKRRRIFMIMSKGGRCASRDIKIPPV